MMRGFRKKHLLATLATALVLMPALVFGVPESGAASFCFGKTENRDGLCVPKFFIPEGWKKVRDTYLPNDPKTEIGSTSVQGPFGIIIPVPSFSTVKGWFVQSYKSGNAYCNEGVCISKDPYANQPRLEMKNRSTYVGSGIKMHLGLYGETGSRWYIRKDSGYPSDGNLDNSDYRLTPDEKNNAKGYLGSQVSISRYCPGEPSSGWQTNLDVKSGGMSGALVSESDRSVCYDASNVIVRKNGTRWSSGNECGAQSIYRYSFHWLRGYNDVVYLDYASWPQECSCTFTGGNCRSDDYREVCRYYGPCPCANDDTVRSDCDNAPYIQNGVGNYQCVNKYRSGWTQVDCRDGNVYEWRYRKVEQVPAFTIEQLNDPNKDSYHSRRASELWNGFNYIMKYSGGVVSEKPVQAIKTREPDKSDTNRCAIEVLNAYPTTDDKGNSYVEYEIHAEGENKNTYAYIREGFSDSQQDTIITALNDVLGLTGGSRLSRQSPTQVITFKLNNLSVEQKGLLSGKIYNLLDSNQRKVLFGEERIAGTYTFQSVAEGSVSDEGHMCRANLSSPLGIRSSYIYFTGVSSLPSPKITTFRIDASENADGPLNVQTQSSQSIETSIDGDRTKPNLQIYAFTKGGQTVNAHQKLTVFTYGQQVSVDLSWNTEHAQWLTLKKYTNHDLRSEESFDTSSFLPSGSKRFDNLGINNTYSFVLMAQNNRGAEDPNNWTDTSFVHLQRIDIEVKSMPLEIIDPPSELPQSALLKGKKACQPNLQSWRTPGDCIEVKWNVKGRPDRVVIKYPKGWDKKIPNAIVTKGDAIGSVKTVDISRNDTRFRIEASRGNVTVAKDVRFTEGPQKILDVVSKGWKDGNNIKNTSLIELLNLADCDEAGFLLDTMCKSFSLGSIISLVKMAVTYFTPLGPIGELIIRVVEPIIFGLIGAITNMINTWDNIVWNVPDQDRNTLIAHILPNLFVGVIPAIAGAFAPCDIAKETKKYAKLILDGAGFVLNLVGWNPLACPAGKQNICDMGEDLGVFAGELIGGVIAENKCPATESTTGGFDCDLSQESPCVVAKDPKNAMYPDAAQCLAKCIKDPTPKQPKYDCNSARQCVIATDQKNAQYANLLHCKIDCSFKRFLGDVGQGWDNNTGTLNELHNRWASNALQQFCPDATGGRTTNKETAMRAVIGSDNPANETGGLRSGNSGLFHCLWTIFKQSGYTTANTDYNGTYYTDGDIPGSTVKECKVQDILRMLQPICAGIAN